MKMNFQHSIAALFLSLFFATLNIVGCSKDAPQATFIEINKKMPLIEWPDSAYIANLDSILALEPLKKNADSKPSIAMNAHKAPTFMLPGSVTGKSNVSKGKKSSKGKYSEATPSTKQKNDNGAEEFMNKFSTALSALQSDPSNPGLYKTVEAKADDDLFKLLKRTYGANAQKLPRFYVLSTLQSVNPGVMLEHLNAGDKVRVPKI